MIDRRALLQSTTGAAKVGDAAMMAMPSEAAAPDPCLAFVTAWNKAIADCEALARATKTDGPSNAFWKEKLNPFFDRATAGSIPPATTAEGAAAALRRVLDWEDMEDQDANLIRSALAFLDGLDAEPAADDPLLAVIDEFRAREAADALISADELDALWDANDGFGPAFKRLRDDPPAATTMAGVEAALRLMSDEDAKRNDWLRSGFLEQAVFPFFKGKPS